jgi:methylase of polypeptide subunit release factors
MIGLRFSPVLRSRYGGAGAGAASASIIASPPFLAKVLEACTGAGILALAPISDCGFQIMDCDYQSII